MLNLGLVLFSLGAEDSRGRTLLGRACANMLRLVREAAVLHSGNFLVSSLFVDGRWVMVTIGSDVPGRLSGVYGRIYVSTSSKSYLLVVAREAHGQSSTSISISISQPDQKSPRFTCQRTRPA